MNVSLRFAASAAALTMALGFSAAAYTVSPPEGSLNLGDYPGGVNSVEINGDTFTINRDAEGFITLSRDGKAIRQIPASNMVDLYTFEGFTKMDKGDVHVTFYNGINGEGSKAGNFEVTVPAGFFTLSDGSLSEAMSFSWNIAPVGLDVIPAGGVVTSLHEFKIELPTTVSSTLKSESITKWTYTGADISIEDYTIEIPEDSTDPIPTHPCTVSMEGNIATLTLDDTYTTPGKYVLLIPAGAFNYTTESGRTVSSIASDHSYQINVDNHGSCEILPAPGTYDCFEPQQYTPEGGAPIDCTFIIKMPENDPITFALKGSAKLYAMNEDGTYNTSVNFGQFSARKADATTLLLVSTSGAAKAVTPPAGRYALEIPANFYQTAAGRNSMYYYEYTVENEIPVTLTPDPAQELKELTTVTLEFSADTELTVGQSYATLTDGVAVYTMAPQFDEATPNVVSYSLPSALKMAGNWTFITPATGLKVNGSPFNMEQTYVLNPDTDGVDAIEVLAGAVDVYGLDGIQVAKGLDFGKVNTLPAGLYIVKANDGATRKIMVK